jgi:hypothetical protein
MQPDEWNAQLQCGQTLQARVHTCAALQGVHVFQCAKTATGLAQTSAHQALALQKLSSLLTCVCYSVLNLLTGAASTAQPAEKAGCQLSLQWLSHSLSMVDLRVYICHHLSQQAESGFAVEVRGAEWVVGGWC